MSEETVPSLGGLVGVWIQEHLTIPDGDRMGDPFLLTAEQWRFLLEFYALDADGRFLYRRGSMLVRPQKWGKSPFAAGIIAAEAAGPTRFDGWDDNGDPIGKPVATPWIQCVAISLEQTANTWRALLPMLQSGDVDHEFVDVGLTRINLPGGGRIEPVTAAHISRVGQRTTFASLDEVGFWTKTNRGRELADALLRNLAGMGGRFMATTNAWNPVEESVGQGIAERETQVYVDDVDPGDGDIRQPAERQRMLETVYGDSASGCEAQGGATGFIGGWVGLERIEAEIVALLNRDPAQSERFFLNRHRASESAAFSLERWDELADLDHTFIRNGRSKQLLIAGGPPVKRGGARIVLGIDGARFADALAVIATEVSTGYQWVVTIVERPELADEDYQHDLDEVFGAIVELRDDFQIERIFIDPQYIEALVDRLKGQFGEKVVFEWLTSRPKVMAQAVRRYTEAIGAGDLSHDADPTFREHIANATRRPISATDEEHRPLYVIAKDRQGSPRKMDAAVAAVISWEARRSAQASGTATKYLTHAY